MTQHGRSLGTIVCMQRGSVSYDPQELSIREKEAILWVAEWI